MNKELIKYLIANINKDFYNLETITRGKEYELTIYPLALNRCLSVLKHRVNVTLISTEKCVYKYRITSK